MIQSGSDMDSSILIPFTFWSNSQPTFRISSICITPNTKKIVTGSYTGQLCLWDLNIKTGETTPKNILIGHKHFITSLVCTDEFVISSCEGGRMCRWNLDDGYCSKTNEFFYIHRHMQLFRQTDQKDELLFTCGDYSEIFMFNPFTLQVIHILNSKSDFSWISNFHVIPSQNNKSDIVSAITFNGRAKLWVVDEFINEKQYEFHSFILPVIDVVDLKYNSSRTELLVVSVKCWMVFDSELLNCTCKVEVCNGERLLGGNFCDLNSVAVWTNSGKFYMYNVSKSSHEICLTVDDCSEKSLFEPSMNLLHSEDYIYFIKGDSKGEVKIWTVNAEKKAHLVVSTALKDKWIASENSFFNSFVKYSSVTCSVYLFELDKFLIGCFDGTIISIPATQSMLFFYFNPSRKEPSFDVLSGHNGKINCLLYPYDKYSYFNKSYLVSGGSDFAVCLWDIINGELLHKFCVQSGEILYLMVPPEDCSSNVKHSICSISSDHSVAVLNLKDKRCVILTSRHEFPVVTVHWKPLDDFIIVECFDGTIYVWQMETGHLDRVLDGVAAQEVLYACDESLSTSTYNFYTHEQITRRNSMKREIFHVENPVTKYPFTLRGFLISEMSECHIFSCNLECLIKQISQSIESSTEVLDCAISQKVYLLSESLSEDLHKKPLSLLEKIKQETEKFQYQRNDKVRPVENNCFEIKNDTKVPTFFLSEALLKMIRLFLSSIHIWGVSPGLDDFFLKKLGLSKPDIVPSVGIVSYSGIYSLFLPTGNTLKSSSLVASNCIAIFALAKILESSLSGFSNFLGKEKSLQPDSDDWLNELFTLYQKVFQNPNDLPIPRPRIEVLAKSWTTKSPILRNVVQKLLLCYLQIMDQKEHIDLLECWYKYLPHFKIVDKTSRDKVDFENVDLKTVALVLFGAVGSDLKFKANDSTCQDNYIYQMCASFVYLMLLPNERKIRFGPLETIAIEFLGRGYIVWEQFLTMEKVIPILFDLCADLPKTSSKDVATKCFAARNALKSIAIARTAAFINFLTGSINQIKLGAAHSDRSNHSLIEKSKPEILSVLTFLLEKTPYIMLLHLNDVISIFIYCIDFSHLKQENIADLIPVMRKFRQVHHSVASQRIAVGLATGSLVVHDLKTGKAHEIPAHKDSVSAIKFSEDGKSLASYSCYENRICFWQVLTGIFGLGHVQVKCTKSCQTYQIHDEEIRNHLEIASLTWTDKKSVVLSLCDGTDTTFHS